MKLTIKVHIDHDGVSDDVTFDQPEYVDYQVEEGDNTLRLGFYVNLDKLHQHSCVGCVVDLQSPEPAVDDPGEPLRFLDPATREQVIQEVARQLLTGDFPKQGHSGY